MKSLLLFISILALTSSCHPAGQANQPSSSEASSMDTIRQKLVAEMAKAQITHFVVKAPNGGFGYTVFIDGKMYIEQLTIPSIEGNKSFATEADAEKIALLVIEKIRTGEMPPTISKEDLTKSGISFP